MLLAPRHARPGLSMHPLTRVRPFLLLLSLLPLLPQQIQPPAPIQPSPVQTEQLAERIGRLPLVFKPAAEAGRFQACGLGGMLFFGRAAVLLAGADSSGFGVRFVGADPAASIEAAEPLPGRVSRFLGSDPARWQRGLPTSAALVYRQLYPGIDLRYDGAKEGLKGTYLLAAGADPARIRWRYGGAGDLRLDPSGDLRIALGARAGRARTAGLTGDRRGARAGAGSLCPGGRRQHRLPAGPVRPAPAADGGLGHPALMTGAA